MQKQKKGFLLFICSLIPGAGEMYMGFFKQGISIMTLFWAIIAIAGGLNISSLVIFLPVLWFYSFFHVHNLKELPEEEFYAVEDNYILHLDRIFYGTKKFTPKHIKIAAVLLIVFGIAVLWNGFRELLFWVLPEYQAVIVQDIMYQIPSIIIGALIIAAGYQLLNGKVKNSQSDDDVKKNTQEHYWQPYRPYQQPTDTVPIVPQNSPKTAQTASSPEISSQPEQTPVSEESATPENSAQQKAPTQSENSAQ